MKNRDKKLKEKIEKKYKIYQENIINKDIRYKGLNIYLKSYPKTDEKCGTFFHMITKEIESIPCRLRYCRYNCKELYEYNPLLNDISEGRMICQKKLDCIDYLKDFNIENYKAYEKYTTTTKGIKHRIILIDEEHSYIYVLEHHKTYVLLWTGYDIPHWKLRKELQKYEQYIETNEILE